MPFQDETSLNAIVLLDPFPMTLPITLLNPTHQRFMIPTLMALVLAKMKKVISPLQREIAMANQLLPDEIDAMQRVNIVAGPCVKR
jgi:hypothetical protein